MKSQEIKTNEELLKNIESILNITSIDRDAINEYKIIKGQLEQHIVPDSYPKLSSNALLLMCMENPELDMDTMRYLGGYCNVAKDWISELFPLLSGKKCLEIMSGAGMLAYALQQAGINIIATDSMEWKYERFWCDVDSIDCVDAIEKYGSSVDFIICSWIPLGSDAGTRALLKMREVNSNAKMIYIGEMGKSCANLTFVEICNIIDDLYIRNANRAYTSWPMIQDRIFLLK